MVILWTLNQGLGPSPLKKLRHLLNVWMLTQVCYPWALNRGSDPFVAALCFLLFKILLLGSYLIEHSHQAFKFPDHSFREPCRLLLYLFLKVVVLILSFHLLSSIILSIYVIFSFHILSLEMIKKYLSILNPRKKRH